MLIYNLFPLLAGPFGNWEPHFKRAAEMGFDCNDLEKMSTEIDIGEQFMHHFHPHKVYMDAMAKHGLEVVPYSGLTG